MYSEKLKLDTSVPFMETVVDVYADVCLRTSEEREMQRVLNLTPDRHPKRPLVWIGETRTPLGLLF